MRVGAMINVRFALSCHVISRCVWDLRGAPSTPGYSLVSSSILHRSPVASSPHPPSLSLISSSPAPALNIASSVITLPDNWVNTSRVAGVSPRNTSAEKFADNLANSCREEHTLTRIPGETFLRGTKYLHFIVTLTAQVHGDEVIGPAQIGKPDSGYSISRGFSVTQRKR